MCEKMVYFLSWTETQKCMFVFSQQGHTNVCLFSHSRVKSLRPTKRQTRQFSLSRVAVTYQRPRVKGVRGMKTSAGAGHSEDSSGGTTRMTTLHKQNNICSSTLKTRLAARKKAHEWPHCTNRTNSERKTRTQIHKHSLTHTHTHTHTHIHTQSLMSVRPNEASARTERPQGRGILKTQRSRVQVAAAQFVSIVFYPYSADE